MLGTGSAPDGHVAFALQTARKNSPVKLYSSPDCGSACDDARKLLGQRGIPFSETSVSQVSQIEELKRISGGGIVPVMLVGSAVQKGFETESYHRALDAAGYPRSNPVRAALPPPPPKPPVPAIPPAAAAAPVNNAPTPEPAKPVQ